MPRGNGMGPAGAGPMTGRGMGPCAAGAGQGAGFGQGMGARRGACRWFGARGNFNQANYELSPEDEKKMIKEDIKAMQARMKELEN